MSKASTNILHEARDLYAGACSFFEITYRQKDLARILGLSPFKLSRLLSHSFNNDEILQRLNWFEGEAVWHVRACLLKRDYRAVGLV
jgi:hypothetical protein